MPLFKIDKVTFNSKTEPVVKGISFEIEKGTTTALLGRSGSGKSTLLKLIDGILVPASGRIYFDGTDIAQMSVAQNKDFRRRCSFVFQDSALWANQDIMQNLMLPLQIHYPEMSVEDRKFTVQSICAMVSYNRSFLLRPADLSTGEQKRIAFARAMICGPEVLFLDECTESLDQKGTETIVNLLHNFTAQGNTIIYVSHNSAFIKEFPGTIHIIEEGRIKHTADQGESA
jgi:ABC-type lipoprotein export system ATPase subunit